MKKVLTIGLVTILSLGVLAGCGQTASKATGTEEAAVAETGKLVVGASTSPHAEILKAAQPLLKEKGYELEIKEFSDYVLPNTALESKELDANYFQHQPYLDDFNKNNNTHIVAAAAIHYEPMGIYSATAKDLSGLKDGVKIAVPNDATNEARALLLLQEQGIIKLKDGVGLEATKKDIADDSPYQVELVEMEAAGLVRALQDVDYAVINGNYALQGGINVEKDALAQETKESEAAKKYANILAVREGDEKREDIKALSEVLQSQEIADFIAEKYQGSVVSIK